MAKLVDALVSGTSVRDDVQVRVLSWAQLRLINLNRSFSFLRINIPDIYLPLYLLNIDRILYYRIILRNINLSHIPQTDTRIELFID